MKKISVLFLVLSTLAPFGMRDAFAENEAFSSGQLSAIERKQDRILQALEELKAELQIVKIRITSQ